MKRDETHFLAWRGDRRRLSEIDSQRNAVAERSAAEIDATTAEAVLDEGSSTAAHGNEVAIRSPRFADPPRFVISPEPIRGEFPISPAPEQRAEWRERIADCFGVEPAAARALLSRLRFHVAGHGTRSPHVLNDALALVHAYAPRNVMEAELVVAMVIASNEASRQLVSSQGGGHLPTLLERTRIGQKFLNLHLQALDRFFRIRGLGTRQTIVVQRMVVSANALVVPGADD
jgi:hypothetical protein